MSTGDACALEPQNLGESVAVTKARFSVGLKDQGLSWGGRCCVSKNLFKIFVLLYKVCFQQVAGGSYVPCLSKRY